MIDPENPSVTPQAAQGLLSLTYTEAYHARMAELASRSNQGNKTAEERRELAAYVFIGDLLSALKSKARTSLSN